MTSAHWTFLLLIIPLVGWCVVWTKFKTITVWEWASSVAAAAVILVAVFGIHSCSLQHDREILSGHATRACHTPWWRAEWQEQETYYTTESDGTDSNGNPRTKQVAHTRWVTKSETHPPRWWLETTLGDMSIDENWFNRICNTYGSYKERGYRPNYDAGDHYDYFSDIGNKSPYGPDIPVHTASSWSNPFVGSTDIRMGQPVDEKEARALGLHEYPSTDNPFVSGRVIGAPVSAHRWDQMCAILGPECRVNLTLINFGDADLAKAVKQRDYWRNGRKNDIVMCYGEGWAYVFGWSKHELVKQELQTLLLENEVNDDLLPKITQVIRKDFQPYEWSKEERTPVPVPTWVVILAFVLMLCSQVGLGWTFHHNEFNKGGKLPWQ